MKRGCLFFSIILCLICLLGIPMHAKADVIAIPEDPFFLENQDACIRIRREFTAKGMVDVYKAPDDSQIVATLEDGQVIYVEYSYTDPNGTSWVLHDNWSAASTGWIPMDSLELVYDAISFMEDHGHEVVDESGSLSSRYQESRARFYEYPGSPDYFDADTDERNYNGIYVDGSGDTWLRIEKRYSIESEAWVNIDQEPPAEEPMETDLPVPSTQVHIAETKEDVLPELLVWIELLIGATIVLLIVLKKRR